MVFCPNIWLHMEGLYLGSKLRENCMNRSGAADLKPDLFPPSGPEEDLCLHAVQPLPPRPSVPEACRVGQQVMPPTRRWAWGARAPETRLIFLHTEPSLFLSPSVHSRWLLGPLFSLPPPFSSILFFHFFFPQRFSPTPHYPSCTKATQTILLFHGCFCCEEPSQIAGPWSSALSSQLRVCLEDQTWPGVLPSVVPAQPVWSPGKPHHTWPAVSCLIPSWLPGVRTDDVGVWWCPFSLLLWSAGLHGCVCVCVCVCGGRLGTGGIILLLVHFYLHFIHLCFLAWGLYRRGVLLCLVSSLIQHLWDASFQLVVLCVMVQGALRCWLRDLSSLPTGVGSWCIRFCHLLLEVFSVLDTLHLCSYNISQ